MRIALVEPSRTVQRIVTGTIGPWSHEVCPFMDAPEALVFLRSDKNIRALISSAELVSTSGMQLVSDARALAGPQRPLYIILMSSSEERSKMIEALDHGADDFIAKPPAPEELRARLRAADRITSMQTELIALATTDSLTGLLTRRAFVEAAERMLQRACTGQPFSVLICDLDKFKAINDTYGHAIGDLVLEKVSREVRSIDMAAGRLGGEEFAFLIGGRLDDAFEQAECLRETVGELAIGAGNKTIRITCSIGAAEWEPGDTIDSLLRRADIALYEAKRSGRNRVIAADSFSVGSEHEQWRGVARLASRRAE
jgi:diguanylate cyclase (GGDEF)-like protein